MAVSTILDTPKKDQTFPCPAQPELLTGLKATQIEFSPDLLGMAPLVAIKMGGQGLVAFIGFVSDVNVLNHKVKKITRSIRMDARTRSDMVPSQGRVEGKSTLNSERMNEIQALPPTPNPREKNVRSRA